MMLGGVPIRVASPPRSEPNESGIISFKAEMLAVRASRLTAGKRIRLAAMLLMNADIAPTVDMISSVRADCDEPVIL